MTKADRVGLMFLVGVLLGILAHQLWLQAQAEKTEPEFLRVNKTIEAMSYDVRGVRSGSWIEVVTLLQHRATGACWVGSYIDNAGHIAWAPAPPSVCR